MLQANCLLFSQFLCDLFRTVFIPFTPISHSCILISIFSCSVISIPWPSVFHSFFFSEWNPDLLAVRFSLDFAFCPALPRFTSNPYIHFFSRLVALIFTYSSFTLVPLSCLFRFQCCVFLAWFHKLVLYNRVFKMKGGNEVFLSCLFLEVKILVEFVFSFKPDGLTSPFSAILPFQMDVRSGMVFLKD